jgi:phosphoketolase
MSMIVKMNKTNATDDLSIPQPLGKMDAYWRAADYLSVGQIYLHDNPLLKQPVKLSRMKPQVVGLWGMTPGSIHEGGELGYSLSLASEHEFPNGWTPFGRYAFASDSGTSMKQTVTIRRAQV